MRHDQSARLLLLALVACCAEEDAETDGQDKDTQHIRSVWNTDGADSPQVATTKSCLLHTGAVCSTACEKTYHRSCLRESIPMGVPYTRVACCFRCCLQYWMTELKLDRSLDWWRKEDHLSGAGFNPAVHGVSALDEVLLGHYSAIRLSHVIVGPKRWIDTSVAWNDSNPNDGRGILVTSATYGAFPFVVEGPMRTHVPNLRGPIAVIGFDDQNMPWGAMEREFIRLQTTHSNYSEFESCCAKTETSISIYFSADINLPPKDEKTEQSQCCGLYDISTVRFCLKWYATKPRTDLPPANAAAAVAQSKACTMYVPNRRVTPAIHYPDFFAINPSFVHPNLRSYPIGLHSGEEKWKGVLPRSVPIR
jgi:hypothetical protein